MDYSKLGKLALGFTQEALRIIREEKNRGKFTVRHEANPYVKERTSITTSADIRAQRAYTEGFALHTPSIKVIAEEKDPLRKQVSTRKNEAVWVVDGIDGTRNFVANASFGYGTQCALLCSNGTVPIAFVGDGVSGDIFGYYGSSGVFRVKENGQRLQIDTASHRKSLLQLGGVRRPSINQYHALSQKLLRSNKCGNVRELLGGIGTTMAWLLTDEIGLFALRPHHERPWDAIPAYALCEKAGMVFMTPTKDGESFEPWRVKHTQETWMRTFDLFVLHEKRVDEFLSIAATL